MTELCQKIRFSCRDALPSLLMLVVTGVVTVCHGHASPISSVYLSPFASFPQKCFSETARGILVLIVFCYEILCLGGHLSNSSYKGTKTMLKNVHSEPSQMTTLVCRYKYSVNECLLGLLCLTLSRIGKIGLTFQPKWRCKFWLAPRPIMLSVRWRLHGLLVVLRLDVVSRVVSKYGINLNVVIYNSGTL